MLLTSINFLLALARGRRRYPLFPYTTLFRSHAVTFGHTETELVKNVDQRADVFSLKFVGTRHADAKSFAGALVLLRTRSFNRTSSGLKPWPGLSLRHPYPQPEGSGN